MRNRCALILYCLSKGITLAHWQSSHSIAQIPFSPWPFNRSQQQLSVRRGKWGWEKRAEREDNRGVLLLTWYSIQWWEAKVKIAASPSHNKAPHESNSFILSLNHYLLPSLSTTIKILSQLPCYPTLFQQIWHNAIRITFQNKHRDRCSARCLSHRLGYLHLKVAWIWVLAPAPNSRFLTMQILRGSRCSFG